MNRERFQIYVDWTCTVVVFMIWAIILWEARTRR